MRRHDCEPRDRTERCRAQGKAAERLRSSKKTKVARRALPGRRAGASVRGALLPTAVNKANIPAEHDATP